MQYRIFNEDSYLKKKLFYFKYENVYIPNEINMIFIYIHLTLTCEYHTSEF